MATGNSVVLSYDSGCRHFVSCQPNNYSLAMTDIDATMLPGAGHLLRADVWFSEPMLAGGNEELFRAARARAGHVAGHQLGPAVGLGRCGHDCRGVRKPCGGSCPGWTWSTAIVRELNQFADSSDLDTTLRQITVWVPSRS